ncbi:MAG: hypothetical protein ACRC68_02135, partial [Clostridium sp.]
MNDNNMCDESNSMKRNRASNDATSSIYNNSYCDNNKFDNTNNCNNYNTCDDYCCPPICPPPYIGPTGPTGP